MSTKVKVNKNDLISKLEENREIHITEFNELKVDYMEAFTKQLKEMTKSVKNGNFNTTTDFTMVKPTSYLKTYDEVIGMLKMSIEDTFEITQDEYRQYVLNDWNWSRSFAITKASYGKF
ncbi:MAG: hypothetical protein ACYDD5_00380 [Sulfuricurvum sp.]